MFYRFISMFLKYQSLLYFLFLIFVLAYAFTNDWIFNHGSGETLKAQAVSQTVAAPEEVTVEMDKLADRSVLIEKLKAKKAEGEALVVHVFVPLCDNDHQGIVQVSKTLGDGFSPLTNLYWGAAYGVSTFFKRASDWTLVDGPDKFSSDVLERIVFYSKSKNTFLVADAYRGDKMKLCLSDYLESLSGKKSALHELEGKGALALYKDADLLVFNGHNGLMDVRMPEFKSIDGVHREASVIACASYGYFASVFEGLGTFPVITTRNLLAPEAYVLKAMVEAWSDLKSEDEIREAVAAAYHKYQKCGLRGARNLFQPGWKD